MKKVLMEIAITAAAAAVFLVTGCTKHDDTYSGSPAGTTRIDLEAGPGKPAAGYTNMEITSGTAYHTLEHQQSTSLSGTLELSNNTGANNSRRLCGKLKHPRSAPVVTGQQPIMDGFIQVDITE